MTDDLILQAAFFIEPQSLALSRDVSIAIRGDQIVAIEPRANATRRAKTTIDCGDAVIMPAFINAHAHLDLSHLRSMPLDGEHFGEWLSAVVASRSAPVSVITTAAELTLNEMKATGCAGVLDILATNQGALDVAKATLDSGVRSAIAVEILSPNPAAEEFMFAKTSELVDDVLQAILAHVGESENQYQMRLGGGNASPRVALSPHAPYSVSPNLYRKVADYCAARGMLQTTHMNESVAEREFMTSGGGKLAALYAAMGLDTSLMRWTDRDGLTTWVEEVLPSIVVSKNETIHAHCYDLSDENVAQLGRHRQTIAYCPRSRRYFGHSPFRMRELLDAGARITIGTDSLGSTKNFNMMEELAVARADLPASVSNAELLRAATCEGLRAVFRPRASDAELAKIADLQVVRTPRSLQEGATLDTLLARIFEQTPLCLATIIGGKPVFRHL